MTAARGVGVGQLVDEADVGPAFEDGIQVHFLQDNAVVLDAAARHLFQIADLRRRFRPAMRLDEADDDVDALPFEPSSFLQHLVSFADAGREAEIDLQPSSLLSLDEAEKMFRRRFVFGSGHGNESFVLAGIFQNLHDSSRPEPDR